ncbi:MAG TPA: response regulator [Pirellulales bacterium]|jgi:DNA-binding response OmpR family regulator|nr:response regulator [Pirellulales bacterium]
MNDSTIVLLIDDDHDVVLGASLRLRAAGYETLTAYDGQEGFATARDNHPDAIVLDVRMPRLDGLSALALLRKCEQTKNIPVIMVSASLVDQHAALDSGARFFLTKPYHPKSLVAALESAMHKA